ncbi:MAG TPA: NrfD/PsrC family molybdoenzyme membrane anchor subunit [Trebonia sp.]
MSGSDVTREGLRGTRPDRDAMTGVNIPRRWRGKRGGGKGKGEEPVIPPAQFTSYYGKPVLNQPVWRSPDIPGYLFLGGLAGGASLLAAGADLTGRQALGRACKAGAFAANGMSLVALIHDLGRRARFLHMLRVFKVTSPMSVGSWLLAGYVPATGVAALAALTGRLPRAGTAATAGAALLGPAVASYTAALISDTAVPAWHDGYPEMPFVFAGSGAMAAGGLGLLTALSGETAARQVAPARNLAVLGTAMEVAASERMERRIGMVAEPYSEGHGGRYVKLGKALAVAGAAGALLGHQALLGRRSGVVAALSGTALIAASAATRWGVYHAGMASAADPRYTVVPQRERLNERAAAKPTTALDSARDAAGRS